MVHAVELDLDALQLPEGEDFGIESDYEVDEDDVELDSGFSNCVGAFLPDWRLHSFPPAPGIPSLVFLPITHMII